MKLKAYFHPGYAAPIGKHIMPIRKFGLVAEALRDASDIDLAEPDAIVTAAEAILRPEGPLRAQRVLITAGPTFEDWLRTQ